VGLPQATAFKLHTVIGMIVSITCATLITVLMTLKAGLIGHCWCIHVMVVSAKIKRLQLVYNHVIELNATFRHKC